MKKKIILNIIALLAVVCILSLLQRLLMPKYVTHILEGSMVEEYYDQKKDHDVIFIGDCEVFESFSPPCLWENYGITSYIRGSAEQLIWQSYYFLEETLTYEKPDVVVFNVLSMKSDKPHKESFNRLSLDGMKLSKSKIKAINDSMLDDEQLITYIFPILRYHSRWDEISKEDFKYLFKKEKVSHNGYLMRTDIKPVAFIPDAKKLPDYRFTDKCYDYLNRITKLCKDNQIELILIKAPSLFPHWYDEWDLQMVEYAKENDISYINFLQKTEVIGLDFNNDTYDSGLHLNVYGAEKLTKYFGRILSEEYSLKDRRNELELSVIWEEKLKFYNEMKQQHINGTANE